MDFRLLSAAIASRVQSGETLGIGSGRTVEAALELIGERIKSEGLEVWGVPTSYRSQMVAERAGITVLPLSSTRTISWAFDGADEVDPALNLIKGRGAAMLPEKIVAHRAGGIVVIVTQEKLVSKLAGAIPVEVIPGAIHDVIASLAALGATEVVLRKATEKYGPVIAESGNLVVDVTFPVVEPALEREMKALVGVVETGLFCGYSREVLVADERGLALHKRQSSGSVSVTRL